MKKLLLADFIAPIDRPLIASGGILINGEKITEVSNAATLKENHPDATLHEFPKCIILPALINAHAHLELTHLTREPAPTAAPNGSIAPWLIRVIRQNTFPQGELEKIVAKSIARAVKQCIQFGVATVGDISRNCRLTRSILSRSPLRVFSFGEIQAMGQRRTLLEERLAIAADTTDASANLRIGISPHAPYSVEPHGYRRALELARQKKLPLCTHLAESPDEKDFLATHSGPLMKVWDLVGGFDNSIPTFNGGPIRFAQSLGLLDYPTLLAHVNHCDDDELTILAAGQASVIYNPRTHDYFNHPPHRWRDMLSRGITVAIGTDSTASSGDLNLVDDLRLLHRLAPDHDPQKTWELATLNAARALGLQKILGSLSPNKLADLAIFPTQGSDPLRYILNNPINPTQLWIGGTRVTT